MLTRNKCSSKKEQKDHACRNSYVFYIGKEKYLSILRVEGKLKQFDCNDVRYSTKAKSNKNCCAFAIRIKRMSDPSEYDSKRGEGDIILVEKVR